MAQASTFLALRDLDLSFAYAASIESDADWLATTLDEAEVETVIKCSSSS